MVNHLIEARGIVTLVTDGPPARVSGEQGYVAVPDVLEDDAQDAADGKLYQQLLELLGREVYVLVLTRAEMTAMCTCGHIRGDHMELTLWQTDFHTGRVSIEPDFRPLRRHYSYRAVDLSFSQWCECTGFQAA